MAIMALGKIIRNKREQLNLTLDEVSAAVSFSKPYLSTIETGKVKNPPSDDLLIKLEKILQFDTGLLVHIAHMEAMPADIRQQYESAEAENKKLRQIIKNLMCSETAPHISSILKDNNIDIEKVGAAIKPGKLIPVINRASTGYPTEFNYLDCPVEIADDYIRCLDVYDADAFAVRVIDDSMETEFSQTDIVVFSPHAEVKSGDDCFLILSAPQQVLFRRVYFESNNSVRLCPVNDNYLAETLNSNRISGMYRAVVKYKNLT